MPEIQAIVTSDIFTRILWAIVIGIATVGVSRVACKGLMHLLNRDENPLPSSSIFVNIVRVTIWVVGAAFILDNCFGVNVTAFVAALGVGGIAISLGFQDTLSNLIGGLQISFMRIVNPGDNIQVGTQTGVVQDVTWRHTTITDCNGQDIIIPNSVISKTAVTQLLPAARIVVPLAVREPEKYANLDALAQQICEATKAAVTPISPIVSDPVVYFLEFTELGVTGKLAFIISDASKTFPANDAAVRAIAPLVS